MDRYHRFSGIPECVDLFPSPKLPYISPMYWHPTYSHSSALDTAAKLSPNALDMAGKLSPNALDMACKLSPNGLDMPVKNCSCTPEHVAHLP
jgi:hypothetical protein